MSKIKDFLIENTSPYEQTMREQKLLDTLCGKDLSGNKIDEPFEERLENYLQTK